MCMQLAELPKTLPPPAARSRRHVARKRPRLAAIRKVRSAPDAARRGTRRH